MILNSANDQNARYSEKSIIVEDKGGNKYIYIKDNNILVPMEQEFKKHYRIGQQLPKKFYNVSGKVLEGKLPNKYNAVSIFRCLENRYDICCQWKLEERLWRLEGTPSSLYGFKSDNVIKLKSTSEAANLLWCLYPRYDVMIDNQKKFDYIINKYDLRICEETEVAYYKTKKIADIDVSKTNDIMDKKGNLNRNNYNNIKENKLLECDYIRCQLPKYERSILYDIKKGHWDIYEGEKLSTDYADEKMIGRDPRKDIKTGVVGIDFGTKSTVVVRQDETNKIIPIRIGTGDLKKQIKASDYENPTIIECIDIERFLDDYEKKAGRPETTCNDFMVSYYAYNDFCTCPPKEFYAYYSDIKQWANMEKENSVIQDKKDKIFKLGSYSLKEQKVINPIELYAYYIGMYINNMRNGIYLKYLLSYPVGYSKQTRELIRQSFENGIKKSLPNTILEDDECMNRFSVSLGISEPAAYAVTALGLNEEIDPEDETQNYMYGIFDFGGGTTDFDFGCWRGASEEEYDIEGYDYVLECFGADSDDTLGGENMLEMLAYAVFKDNADLARQKRLVCILPYGETLFLGSEMLVSDSKVAMRNMSVLKEELRPLWHQEEGWEKKYNSENDGEDNAIGQLELTLYNADGDSVPNCRLAVDTDKLIGLIKKRIQKGVDAFFRSLEKTFQFNEKTNDKEKVYIFLAGNSCKSVFVKEAFENKIKQYYEKFKKIDSNSKETYFELIHPLNDNITDGDVYIPNAKTSVAYGLVKSREGSSIKIIKNYETNANEETRFKYYLGRERRGKFECKLSPVLVKYNEWVRFQGAVKNVVRIYYTSNPLADSQNDKLAIDNIKYKEFEIEPKEGMFVYIRTVSPESIEYIIASEEENIGEKETFAIHFNE